MVQARIDNFMEQIEERFVLLKGQIIKRGARVGGGVLCLSAITGDETFVSARAVVTTDTKQRASLKVFQLKYVKLYLTMND